MKQSLTHFIVLALSLVMAVSAARPGPGAGPPSREASAYFEQAFAFIQNNAYFHKHLDFAKVKQQALAKMQHAQSAADTHDAIRFVLEQLDDRHSFLQPARPAGAPSGSISARSVMPFEVSVEGNYGIIKLKSYNSTDAANAHRIADSLYNCLLDFDKKHTKGTIIDLREMEGGTYIPFVTGLAPMIDAEQLIGFVDRKGKKGRTVRYQNGIYYQQGRKKARLGYLTRYERPNAADRPIAVLTGQYTASSGEMILLSLKGLPRTRTFGAPTYGVPTGKANFFLPDSSMISLTNTACFDRQKQIHSGAIQPDVPCAEKDAMREAKNWIDHF
ncbi:S41 family peptidase [Dyadobacter fermentans]|uniref:Peptidase S41 n=1 Tax=Dyadobacter fermentans (strain ATCC 700827 / DSM 18053 / CIP 107007 / KCTC 52180 / NS114) TaxID=471854 RepID=C6VZJ2_DYAFD|nr:S41 family peptidase [Dyadobacter fermentans]ACT93470.1 peptidase S41 [Dyadobacter fermentans DSM 18053]